jgi:hypothetical protein
MGGNDQDVSDGPALDLGGTSRIVSIDKCADSSDYNTYGDLVWPSNDMGSEAGAFGSAPKHADPRCLF